MTVRRTTRKPAPSTPVEPKSLLPFWLKVGALAQLVSGSFPMTVLSIQLDQPINGDTPVTCIWAGKYSHDLSTRELPLSCLQPFTNEDQDIPW